MKLEWLYEIRQRTSVSLQWNQMNAIYTNPYSRELDILIQTKAYVKLVWNGSLESSIILIETTVKCNY